MVDKAQANILINLAKGCRPIMTEWVQAGEINGSQMTRLSGCEKYPVPKYEITKQTSI